jgi:hypothetical protein
MVDEVRVLDEAKELAASVRSTAVRAPRARRRVQLHIVLSDDEADALDRCAERWGLDRSGLVRFLVREDEKRAEEDAESAAAWRHARDEEE